MSIGTILLGVFALWVFVCLWITMPLSTVRESAWHYQILIGRPKGNCAYFWLLLISPTTCVVTITISAVFMIVLILFRFLFDWLIMPICGKRVKGVLTQGYWKGFLELPEKRFCDYVEFRYRSYWIGIISLLALIAWIFAGFLGFYNLSTVSQKILPLLGTGVLIWSIITLVILYCILSEYFKDSEKWHDFKEGAGLISGKLCRRLKYENTEVNNEED